MCLVGLCWGSREKLKSEPRIQVLTSASGELIRLAPAWASYLFQIGMKSLSCEDSDETTAHKTEPNTTVSAFLSGYLYY